MMYDDIANNEKNPYKGKIFNIPNGPDVYAGVHIDYKDKDVTSQNFAAVLLGDSQAAGGKKVLQSTKEDKVFIYFTDHGNVGLMGFPTDILTLKNFSEILIGMNEREMYKELTFYLETCEAGSMFNFSMPENIYVMAASNTTELSWGCHCRTKFLPNNCLNDCFSYNWMHDSDKGNLLKETLNQQFVYVQKKTRQSPVSVYGTTSIMQEHVSEFMGSNPFILTPIDQSPQLDPTNFPSYSSIDIPLNILEQELLEKKDVNTKKELQTLKKNRSFLDDQINQIVKLLINDSSEQLKVLTQHPQYITNIDCHHNVMHTFNDNCFRFSESTYAFKYGYVLTNLCESGIDSNKIENVLETHCNQAKTLDVKGII